MTLEMNMKLKALVAATLFAFTGSTLGQAPAAKPDAPATKAPRLQQQSRSA